MAIIDTERGVIAVRIAYDGEASAGKTTNLYALSSSLSRDVFTPEQAGERTLYFDWLDYTGGLFEGMQIRCEVVSVPGQRMLSARRERLLRDADVVVLVVDASLGSTVFVADRLSELRAELECDTGIDPAILVQANKRDLCRGSEITTLRQLCERQKPLVAFLESVAVVGEGVRETFVLAVRLALDRVRELRRCGHLDEGEADLDGHALLRWMKSVEGHETVDLPVAARGPEPSDEVGALVRRVVAEASEVSDRPSGPRRDRRARPAIPDAGVSSGMIWPPVEGRIVLTRVVGEAVRLDRLEHAWSAVLSDRWRLQSPDRGEFTDVQAARGQLIRWARSHAALGSLLSGPRCIVVADTEIGSWRLWQLVKIRPSLRDLVASSLRHSDVELVADTLVAAGAWLVEMNDKCAGRDLPQCSLDTVGEGVRGVEFIGLYSESAEGGAPEHVSSSEQLLEREFASVVPDWQSISEELVVAIERCGDLRGDPGSRLVARTLTRMMMA